MAKRSKDFVKIILKDRTGKYSSDSNFLAPKEFHISRKVRDKYQFDENLFSLSGNVIFANFHAVRQFVHKMNQKRDLVNYPEQAVKAGKINAMGLIDEILHYVVQLYQEQKNPDIHKKALAWLIKKNGKDAVINTLRRFAEEFPPLAVYKREINLEEYLAGDTKSVPNLEILLEEMMLLWLENVNTAFSPFQELFDDSELERHIDYVKVITDLQEYFETQPFFGPENQNLIEMLRSPAIAVPHSLQGQLQYILEKWGSLLGKYLYRLLGGLDLIKEEEKIRFAGPGPTRVYDFFHAEDELERFSTDRYWMPRLVLIAKSTLVWMDQLSKKYQQSITRLDQIPDEELDQIANWGFTGLWLIGIWERSSASKKIKQLCGNPEAESSAYSLYDYIIASELGGEEAFNNLKSRCWQRGIRLASDMVPNHTGIYSKWVVEHPNWFISQDHSPFPAYSFNGPNLSEDERVGIYIEDHYYDQTDAAVVFKRVDFNTGNEKYIFHGNDGTSMPWNDTAQLNYLNPEVREAVIRTILHVAKKTPIIRFDAAMTLTKKHYQRLWFPEPGTGGDIPSRTDHAMTKEEFNSLIPEEFWREVVDRVAQEEPDTLLLAEAFWFMEGYFVRTLGMHRVYNSAFMNMLKNEENSKYREVIKKTLEFNPEILKRYVNFMNNPDEETAVAQFGKDDKYFGVCVMMITMPGLPMFGHGQIEGFTEKYGMEYRRAYWDEKPDWQLIQRHEREIFPLIKKRYLFAEVENFLLYDFFAPEGFVNENVFAYSNRHEGDCALIIYNNKFEHARGWIRTSTAYLMKGDDGKTRHLIQKSLAEGLGLQNDDHTFCIFRDCISGLEYIRSNRQLRDQGLYVELDAFKYHVFLDFREVQDNEWQHYAQLNNYLDGRGVPSIEQTMKEMFLQPIHHQFENLMKPEYLKKIMTTRIQSLTNVSRDDFLNDFSQKYSAFLEEIKRFTSIQTSIEKITNSTRSKLSHTLWFESIEFHPALKQKSQLGSIIQSIKNHLSTEPEFWEVILGWLFIHEIGKLSSPSKDFAEISRSWIDEWLLNKIMNISFHELNLSEAESERAILLIKILVSHQRWFDLASHKMPVYQILKQLIQDSAVRDFLQINRYQDILWFNKEAFESLTGWLFIISVIDGLVSSSDPASKLKKTLSLRYQLYQHLLDAEKDSNYQLEKLLELVKKEKLGSIKSE